LPSGIGRVGRLPSGLPIALDTRRIPPVSAPMTDLGASPGPCDQCCPSGRTGSSIGLRLAHPAQGGRFGPRAISSVFDGPETPR
jgi:hypothetical protein